MLCLPSLRRPRCPVVRRRGRGLPTTGHSVGAHVIPPEDARRPRRHCRRIRAVRTLATGIVPGDVRRTLRPEYPRTGRRGEHHHRISQFHCAAGTPIRRPGSDGERRVSATCTAWPSCTSTGSSTLPPPKPSPRRFAPLCTRRSHVTYPALSRGINGRLFSGSDPAAARHSDGVNQTGRSHRHLLMTPSKQRRIADTAGSSKDTSVPEKWS